MRLNDMELILKKTKFAVWNDEIANKTSDVGNEMDVWIDAWFMDEQWNDIVIERCVTSE